MRQSVTISQYAKAHLAKLETQDRCRKLIPTARGPAAQLKRNGQALISFCDNDYLGLSQDARVIKAAQDATAKYGTSAGASRLVTGNNPLNGELETQLAQMKGLPAACIFGSGYLANIGTIPALVGSKDIIIMDELSHACMHAGAQLSKAQTLLFKHNDLASLEALLQAHMPEGRTLVMTETIFSMDGDTAPLTEINTLCERYGAWLMTDDAHGLGILDFDNPAPIQMGTLSKAAGSYGGYVCGDADLIHLLVNRARSLVYTTGLPPAALAASLAALKIMSAEPELRQTVLGHARLFCELLELPSPQSMIVPIIYGSEKSALSASTQLQKAGFLVSAIRPPTVPEGTSRLRITFNAAHKESDVRALAAAIKKIGKHL